MHEGSVYVFSVFLLLVHLDALADSSPLLNALITVYRDARSLNRFQIATVTKTGAHISEPQSVTTSWGFAEGLRGYGPQTQ